MAGIQFQIESATVTGGQRFRTERSEFAATSRFSRQTGLQALLLGIHLRGRLCDRERELIDDLCPERHLAFVTIGDEYLHPQDLPLFPEDVTSELSVLDSSAFSYRRLHTGMGRCSGTFGVHTAQIGRYQGQPLVFGIAGPDVAPGEVDRDHLFAHVVYDLRQADSQSSALAERLQKALRSDSPVALVVRSSGRVLAINAAMQTLLPTSLGDIVDSEWSEAKRALIGAIGSYSLKLESVNNDDISVAVVTFTHVANDSPNVTEFESFLDLVQHKAAALAASARHLRGLACCVPGETNSELVQIILEEAEDLRTCLDRLRTIDSFEGLMPTQFDLMEELRLATLQVLKGNHQASIVISNDEHTPVRLQAPRKAARSLIETLLRLHLNGSHGDGKTELFVRPSRTTVPTILEFISRDGTLHEKARHADGAWLAYAGRLASLLGWRLRHSSGVDFRTKSVLELHPGRDRI